MTPPPDVISAGPRPIPPRLIRGAVVIVLAAALAAAALAAIRCHSQAPARHPVATRGHSSSGQVTLAAALAALPSAGRLAGEATAATAHSPSGALEVIITARITGGRPHTRYQLYGGDCSINSAGIWAAGRTSGTGSATLTGAAEPVLSGTEYYLTLSGPGIPHNHPGPAVNGQFGPAPKLAPVPGSIAPCA